MPAEVSVEIQAPKEGEDAKRLKATRQGMYYLLFLRFPLNSAPNNTSRSRILFRGFESSI